MVKVSWYKKLSLTAAFAMAIVGIWLFLTSGGESFRTDLAKTIITTRYQQYAWVFVGKVKSKQLIEEARSYAIP